MEDVLKDNEFCRKYGMLSGKLFKDYGETHLSDKTVVDYLGLCRDILCSKDVNL